MSRALPLLLLLGLAACNDTDQAPPGLTADENRRLEEAARMLDEEREATTPESMREGEAQSLREGEEEAEE